MKKSIGNVGHGNTGNAVIRPRLDSMIVDADAIVRGFLNGIRDDVGNGKPDNAPLDATDKESIADCDRITMHIAIMSPYTKVLRASVAYKIDAEKLWRAKYDSAVECVGKKLGIEQSAAYRYIVCGKVIHAIMPKYNLACLPDSLDALEQLARLKDKHEILKIYEAALEIASASCQSGKVTKKVIQTAMTRRAPQESIAPASSEPYSDIKQVIANDDLQANHSDSEPCIAIKAVAHPSRVPAPKARIKPRVVNEKLEEPSQQVNTPMRCDAVQFEDVKTCLAKTIDIAQAYVRISKDPQYLDQAMEIVRELHEIFRQAAEDIADNLRNSVRDEEDD